MKLNKDLFNDVLKINTKVFGIALALSFLIYVVRGVYYIGYVNGFNSSSIKVAQIPEDKIVIITTTPAPTKKGVKPTPTKVPQSTTVTTTTYGYKVSWGGPELWDAVNKRRTEFGVNPLDSASDLCTIASIRLNELLELGKLDGHEGFSNMPQDRPDLSNIFQKYSTLAEFLAVGGQTPQETVSLWEHSLGHKQLLTGGEYVWGCIYSQNTFAVAIAAY